MEERISKRSNGANEGNGSRCDPLIGESLGEQIRFLRWFRCSVSKIRELVIPLSRVTQLSRKATIGSTRLARHAGPAAAPRAATVKITTTPASVAVRLASTITTDDSH